MRFFKNDGTQVMSGGSAYELTHDGATVYIPWAWEDIFEIQYAQNEETLLFFHEDYQTVALVRTSDTVWSCDYYAMYDDEAETSPIFNSADNYPRTGVFFEGRLFVGFTKNNPRTIYGSQPNDFNCFDTMAGATVDSSDGLELSIAANKASSGLWLAGENLLYVGTPSGVLVVSGAEEYLNPVDYITARRQSPYGCADVQGLYFGGRLLYVQSDNKTMRGITYNEQIRQYSAQVMNLLSRHIAGDGFAGEFALQENPQPIVWGRRSDGQLTAFTVDMANGITAWSRVVLDGEVESIAIIPSSGEDMLWMLVKREIDGSTARYVEYMKPRDFGSDKRDAWFVNSGISFDVETKDVSAISKSATATITFATEWEDDILVRFSGVTDMPEVNDEVFMIKNGAGGGPYVYELYLSDGITRLDSSGYSAAASDGLATRVYKTLAGLSHLEGEELSVLADGAKSPDVTVSSGQVTLDDHYSRVIVGKGYQSILRPMPLAPPGELATVLKLKIGVYESMGGKVGGGLDDLYYLDYRNLVDMDSGPDLFTGVVDAEINMEYGRDVSPYISQNEPFPFNVMFIKIEEQMGEF
jgi:hypothetical protein